MIWPRGRGVKTIGADKDSPGNCRKPTTRFARNFVPKRARRGQMRLRCEVSGSSASDLRRGFGKSPLCATLQEPCNPVGFSLHQRCTRVARVAPHSTWPNHRADCTAPGCPHALTYYGSAASWHAPARRRRYICQPSSDARTCIEWPHASAKKRPSDNSEVVRRRKTLWTRPLSLAAHSVRSRATFCRGSWRSRVFSTCR